MTAEPRSPVETPAADAASPARAEGPAPRAPAELPESPAAPTATAPPAPTAGAAADAEDLEITTDLGEEEDPTDPAKAYVSPRAVPKAALPAAEEAAKVVINIPTPAATAEEITQAIDKDALERQRLREEQRRREPTVRIPRKDVQAVREEIAAREALATSDAGPSTSPEHPGSVRPVAAPIARGARELDPIASARAVPPTRDFEAIAPVETRSGSKAPILLVVVALAAAGAGGFWFMNRSSAPSSPPANPAVAANQPVRATTATAITPAAPPLQLTAEPASTKPDPNAITLDAEAASAPGTAPSVEQRPVALPPPTNAGVAPPPLNPTHAPQPVAPQPPPVKPVTTAKPFTPQSI